MNAQVLIAIVAVLIGLSKGGVGGPIAVGLILPLLSRVMDPKQAIGLTLPLLIFADLFAMRYYWGQWNRRYMELLLPAAVIGVVFGALTLRVIPSDLLKQVVGAFSLGIVAYKFLSVSLSQLEYSARAWHGVLAGWTGGFASTLASVGGPPVTAFLLLQKPTPSVFVGTVTLFFFIVNLLKVPLYLLLGQDVLDVQAVLGILWVLPIIPLGVWLGRRIVLWLDPRVFEWIMIALLLYSGLTLLFG